MISARYPQVTEHGVFREEDCEALTLPGKGGASPSAEVLLVEAGPGEWYASVSFSLHAGDYRSRSSLPSPRSRQAAHPDRHAALLAMAECLLIEMRDILSGSRVPGVEAAEARRVLTWAPRLGGESGFGSYL